MKGASLWKATVLLANIRLFWKGLPGTNTLAYEEHKYIKELISFITLEPVVFNLEFFKNSYFEL